MKNETASWAVAAIPVAASIALSALKLAGVISWSWLWVAAPVWIAASAAAILLIAIILLVAWLLMRHPERMKRHNANADYDEMD